MKRPFGRSECEVARNHARKARRRGDVAMAHHWLRLADRYLVVSDQFNEAVANWMRREDRREQEFQTMLQIKVAEVEARRKRETYEKFRKENA